MYKIQHNGFTIECETPHEASAFVNSFTKTPVAKAEPTKSKYVVETDVPMPTKGTKKTKRAHVVTKMNGWTNEELSLIFRNVDASPKMVAADPRLLAKHTGKAIETMYWKLKYGISDGIGKKAKSHIFDMYRNSSYVPPARPHKKTNVAREMIELS